MPGEHEAERRPADAAGSEESAADSHDWWAKNDEVIRHQQTGEVRHVTSRLLDVDTGTHRYEVEDDTHTTRSFWHEEDLKVEYEKVGAIVHKKPKHVLDGRFYDAE